MHRLSQLMITSSARHLYISFALSQLKGVSPLFFCLQSEIKILSTTVFVDPYEEADAEVRISLFAHISNTDFILK